MRVSKSGSRREPLVPKKGKSRSTSAEPAFAKVLRAEQMEELDLVQALEEIDEYAERLRRNPIMENLLRYKGRIRALLRFLVEHSYTVQESTFYDPQGRRRLLMLVETIDEKLEGLTRGLLIEQDDNLELLGRLDEIRGLLLDLYS